MSCRELFYEVNSDIFDVKHKIRYERPTVYEHPELCQTEEELSLILELKSMAILQKQGNWSVGINKSGFCILLPLVMQNGFTTITAKDEIIRTTWWSCFSVNSQAEDSWRKTHVTYLVSCMMSCWDPLLNTTGESESSLQKKNAHTTTPDTTCMKRVVVASPVESFLQTLNWEVLPHPPY